MPGRLLFGALAPKFDTLAVNNFKANKNSHSHHHHTSHHHSPPVSLLPPEYSFHPPNPTPKSRSQESLLSMDALIKRHHLVPKHTEKKTPKSPKMQPHKSATLDMAVESPPIMFYNSPQSSTGAIFSGQLLLTVLDPLVTINTFEMRLMLTVSTKKPVAPHCPDCTSKTSELHKWEFQHAPTPLKQGVHNFPFSHLLPGHFPATTQGHLASLTYHLEAVATTSTGEKITFTRPLETKRAILPGGDKHSIRIFPPTNITATVTLPPIIHAIGEFPVELRISGIVTNKENAQTRWRLRKLNWRIEETQKFTSPACDKHLSKVGGDDKGISHEDVRVVGHSEVKNGWKTDFVEGNIDVQFQGFCDMALKPTCDMTSASGMQVKHNFIVEMVVAEEWAPLKKPNQATPTGAARVLRMQFHTVLTERAGLGISWDEEQPPTYDDVPPSPPVYPVTESVSEYDASLLSPDDSSDSSEHLYSMD